MDSHLVAARFYPDNAQVNRIWRFFSDSDHQWRWERLAFNGTVLEHSESGFAEYESCLAKAAESCYLFLASSSTKAMSNPSKKKRSYAIVARKHPKSVSKIAAEGHTQTKDIPIEIEDTALDASEGLDSQ